MSDWPQLVAEWDALHPADIAICTTCEREAQVESVDVFFTCTTCGGQMLMKYELGVPCANCGALDYEMPLKGTMVRRCDGAPVRPVYACSRSCWLQLEYASQLQFQQAQQPVLA